MKTFKNLTFAACAVMSLSLASCDKDDNVGGDASNASAPVVVQLPEGTRAITESANDFSFRLFREYAVSGASNVVISPLNVMSTLAMLANGDNGESRNEILRVLGRETSDADMNNLTAYCNSLFSQLPEVDRSTDLRFANSFWYSPGVTLDAAFTEILSGQFSTEFINKPVGGTEGMSAVNDWVKSKTGGTMSQILDTPLDENTQAALLDAVYFKGMWREKFDRSLTTSAAFRNIDGSESDVMFMVREGEYSYTPLEDMRAISLPYGNGNFKMTVILPEGGNDLRSLASSISSRTIADLEEQASYATVSLYLPKFECSSNEDIMSYLQHLGVNRLFDASAGMNSIYSSGNFFAGMFRHSVSVKVDEDGSEGSASSVVPDGIISPGYNAGEMKVDRPFMFVISETTTNAIIFVGQITNL
ncbi:MAG: hypothetical protein K2L59_08795 [Muribaculaceae bacterium]|nr:hypothetical protein [Muribaculaceae bacterium]